MDAAEADNHSDISLLSINDLRAVGHQISDALWNSCLVDITFESSRLRTARSSPCAESVVDLEISRNHLRTLKRA